MVGVHAPPPMESITSNRVSVSIISRGCAGVRDGYDYEQPSRIFLYEVSPGTQMHISGKPHFQLGSGFCASTLEPNHYEVLRCYSVRAQETPACHQACLPDDDRFALSVRPAMEASLLFFLASINEPTTYDLDRYFDHFVTQSVAGCVQQPCEA